MQPRHRLDLRFGGLGLGLLAGLWASTRSFAGPPGAADRDLLARLRRRPAPGLVALLARRLRRFDPERQAHTRLPVNARRSTP